MGANMLKDAFKEWAVICRALAEGRQAFILRKGGIAEAGNTFKPEHKRFWLYPTYVHQQEHGIKPEFKSLLEEAEKQRPPKGIVRLSHFVEVPGVYHVAGVDSALLLNPYHLWTEETVRQRFAYRHHGLYVLPARVYRMPSTFDLIETPAYAGCKSWVELEQDLPTDEAVPVLDDEAFKQVLRRLDALLNPTAFA
jgi:hypothetical protein